MLDKIVLGEFFSSFLFVIECFWVNLIEPESSAFYNSDPACICLPESESPVAC